MIEQENDDLDNLRRLSDYKRERHKKPRLEMLCMASVSPKPIEWLWLNRLAIGKVSMLAGEGGQGKSTILCDLAARTSTGARWPDGAEASRPGSVIILAAEDDVDDTLAPRLIAAGANMQRVHNIRGVVDNDQRRSFNLQADLAALEQELQHLPDARLVIIDPISSYLGRVDSHKNADVRAVLEPLGELASRCRVAVLANNHFSKGGGDANSRMIGSVAFVNYARAGFIVTPDAENEGRRLFLQSKTNIGPMMNGLAYRIGSRMIPDPDGGDDILTSEIVWETDPVKITANEALAAMDEGFEGKTAKTEAVEFLQDILAAGPMKVAEINQQAREAGISSKALRSARESLGIKTEKSGMQGGWIWALPKMPNPSEDARG